LSKSPESSHSSARPEQPKLIVKAKERAERPKMGVAYLGRGSEPDLYTAVIGLGSAVSSSFCFAQKFTR